MGLADRWEGGVWLKEVALAHPRRKQASKYQIEVTVLALTDSNGMQNVVNLNLFSCPWDLGHVNI